MSSEKRELVMDREGRVTIPADWRDTLGIKDKDGDEKNGSPVFEANLTESDRIIMKVIGRKVESVEPLSTD